MNHIAAGIGEVLWDLFPDRKTLGGAPANFAYHVRQFGLEGYPVSAVGNDALGDETIRVLDAVCSGVHIQRDSHPTGAVTITLDREGIPHYTFQEQAAWDNIVFDERLERLAAVTDIVCFGSLAQRHAQSRGTIRRFIGAMPDNGNTMKVFDINLRQEFYSKELLHESLSLCNILKINDEELDIAGEMFGLGAGSQQDRCLELLRRYNLRMAILTCGAAGSYVLTPDTVSFKNTPQVKVCDTVGAGDSFTATLCAALSCGKSIAEAHGLAVEVSAYVCTCHGSMPAIPGELKSKVIG